MGLEGSRWIPKHPKTEKGIVIDKMIGEFKISIDLEILEGQHFELLLNSWADNRQLGELKHLGSKSNSCRVAS